MSSATENRFINLYINNRQAGKSLSDIRNKYRRLSAEINRGELSQKEYNAKVAELRKYGAILDDHRRKVRGVGSSWESVKKIALGVFGGNIILTVLTKIANFIPNMVKRNAELADSFADVRKTTDLSEVGMQNLYTALKAIDTRTPRKELLELARDAGKLGIEGVQNIAGFVKAADTIRVALGEDLGEDAVKTIGKLNNLFGTSAIYGYEQGLQKLGSVINELGASSEASEGAIVDFVGRLAGVATQANITFAEVAGIGAALDSLGQRTEMSGTAISQAIIGMFSDTAEYAGVAGMSVKDFTELLETDANAAFVKFLEGLNGNNDGLSKMAARFDGLGINGNRAITVLGALAGNTKLLAEQQEIANKAYDEGISLQNEFNIKNRNMAGNLEKIGKSLAGIWINSGLLRGLEKAVSWFEKLVRLPVDRDLQRQRIAANGLVMEIVKLNAGTEERIAKIRQLKQDYPELTGHIEAETATNKELLGVMRDLNEEYLKRILIARRQEEIGDVEGDIADAMIALDAAQTDLTKARERLLRNATDKERELYLRNEERVLDFVEKVQDAATSAPQAAIKILNDLQKQGLRNVGYSELLQALEAMREFEKREEKRNEQLERRQKLLDEINRISAQLRTGSVGLGEMDVDGEVTTDATEVTDTTTKAADPEKAKAEAIKKALEPIQAAAEAEALYLENHRAAALIDQELFEEEMLSLKMAYLMLEIEAIERLGGDATAKKRELAQLQIQMLQGVEAEAKKKQDAAEAQKAADEAKEEADEEATKAAIENAAWRGKAAVESAETSYEAAVATINMIRAQIKEHILQTVAEEAAKAMVGVPFPYSLIVAGAAGAAVSHLFDRLIPQAKLPEKPAFEHGTAFFGGSAIVGEQGREEVRLPFGSSVIPADITQQILAANAFSRPSPQPNFSAINDGLTYTQSRQQLAGGVDAGTAGVDLAPLLAEMRAMREDLQRAQDKRVVFTYRDYMEFRGKFEAGEKRVKLRL